jgi:hypothetical protein
MALAGFVIVAAEVLATVLGLGPFRHARARPAPGIRSDAG